MQIYREGNKLVIANGKGFTWIEPWGTNSLRVRMSAVPQMDTNDWALTEKMEEITPQIVFEEIDVTDPWYRKKEYEKYHQTAMQASITNGKITAKVSHEGWISFYNQKGVLLTEEYWRTRDRINRYCAPLRIVGRELKPIQGSTDFELTSRFEAFDDEKIFGMGQYQEKNLNKKGQYLNWHTEIRRQAFRLWFQAGDTAFFGIIQQLAPWFLVRIRQSGMQKARKSLIIL